MSRGSIEATAGTLAALAVVAAAAVRIALNAPVGLPDAVAAAHGPVKRSALVVPAGAALALGFAADDPADRVGLVAIGVFGGLSALVPAARVPAMGAIVAGGAFVAAARLPPPRTWAAARRALVAGALLAAAGASLGSAAGLLAPPARTVGSALAMLGLAATPALVPGGRRGWLAGGIAFVVVAAAGAAAPFVTGAVALVGGAVVGVPLLLVALGIAGGATTVARAAIGARGPAALGGTCLLAAGVPATAPRALAVVLGLALLLGGTHD